MTLIRTRYHGPADARGSRITADDGRGHRVSVSYDHSADDGGRLEAAQKLSDKMNWGPVVEVGTYKEDRFYRFKEE